jgi:pimeloyl-ACP methyl ester carboxylesterase
VKYTTLCDKFSFNTQFDSILMMRSLRSASIVGLLAVGTLVTAFDLPRGNGPYETTFSEFELVDHARQERFNSSSPRRLMLSRFDPVFPADCLTRYKKPYMSPLYSTAFEAVVAQLNITVPRGFFTQPELDLCKLASNTTLPSVLAPDAPPLIVFSPGNGGTRFLYSVFAQELASRGFTVLAIDHTYNSAVVEFPNGDVVYGVADNYPSIEEILQTWVEPHARDISFVLDHFGLEDYANATRAVVMGHSLGGAVAHTVLRDRRIRGAVNLDGPVSEGAQNATIGSTGREQAVVLWQQESLDDVPFLLAGWARYKETVRRSAHADFLAHVGLKSTKHYAFLDGPLLFDLTGLRDEEELRNPIVQAFGTISGKRYMEVMGLYTQTFVEYLFSRKGIVDLDIYVNPTDDFSDVEVVL